jgi:formylglycine-generating enzyme required for sulfatase activity
VKRQEAERQKREKEAQAEQKRRNEDNIDAIPSFTYICDATYSCGGLTYTVQEYRHDQTGMEFVMIPGGKFLMGSKEGDSDEKPAHQVTVKPFLMSRYEITQAVWEKVMGKKTDWGFPGPDNPAENISWNECQQFCQKTGLQLPTEAQWEYACRAGTTTEYYWGNDMDGEYSWYGENSGGKPHPVGKRKSNAFGLFDMSGNVWEWSEDSWHDGYQGSPDDGKAWVSEKASGRIKRGGSCSDTAIGRLRSAFRSWVLPGGHNRYLGARVVCRWK